MTTTIKSNNSVLYKSELMQKVPQNNSSDPVKQDEMLSKSAKLMIGAVALSAVVVGGMLVHHKISINHAKQVLKNNESMEEIFNTIKIDLETSNQSSKSQNLTIKEFFDKYIQSYDATGKTFYHGTTKKTAEKIAKQGMCRGLVGPSMGNWRANYLTEDVNVAKSYASRMSSIQDTQGAFIHTKLPDGTKLAQFVNEDGEIIRDVMPKITKSMESLLKSKKLESSEFIDFLQNKLIKNGFAGVRSFDSHTGITPIVFNGELVKVTNIVNV